MLKYSEISPSELHIIILILFIEGSFNEIYNTLFYFGCFITFAERELLIKKLLEILKLLDRVWKLPDEKS